MSHGKTLSLLLTADCVWHIILHLFLLTVDLTVSLCAVFCIYCYGMAILCLSSETRFCPDIGHIIVNRGMHLQNES